MNPTTKLAQELAEKCATAITGNYLQNGMQAIQLYEQRKSYLAEIILRELNLESLLADKARWGYYASSPQTALILGSALDPCDTGVDWVSECNQLADSAMSKEKGEQG